MIALWPRDPSPHEPEATTETLPLHTDTVNPEARDSPIVHAVPPVQNNTWPSLTIPATAHIRTRRSGSQHTLRPLEEESRDWISHPSSPLSKTHVTAGSSVSSRQPPDISLGPVKSPLRYPARQADRIPISCPPLLPRQVPRLQNQELVQYSLPHVTAAPSLHPYRGTGLQDTFWDQYWD
jgi:hypothetical protein